MKLLQGVSPLARHKIEHMTRTFQSGDWRDVGEILVGLGTLPSASNKSWLAWARAWVAVRLAVDFTDPDGAWCPNRKQLAALLKELGTKALMALQAEVGQELRGDFLINALHRARTRSDRTAWDPAQFTDPANHSSGFCYLIHAMGPDIVLPVPEETGKLKTYFEETYGSYLEKRDSKTYLRVAQLYLEQPARLLTEVLSCSLIDAAHTKTYKNFCFGLILAVPAGNIVTASHGDMTSAVTQNAARGSMLTTQAPLDAMLHVDRFLRGILSAYQYELPSPTAVLAKTKGHNEVLVMGSFASDRVRIAGIFVKVTASKKLVQDFVDLDAKGALSKSIKLCSETNKIPIVDIVEEDATGSTVDFDAWKKFSSATVSTSASTTVSTSATTTATSTASTTATTTSATVLSSTSVSSASSLSSSSRETVARPRVDPYAPPMGLHFGSRVTYRDANVIREYFIPEIVDRAEQLLAQNGYDAMRVHRELHDNDGIPHQICEYVLRSLGYRGY